MATPRETRIYVVQAIESGAEALVRAVHPAMAERHVSIQTAPQYRARVATQRDLERLLGDGLRVQDATPEPAEVRGT